MVTQILFWTALGLILYTYFGFPLLLLVRGSLQRRPLHKSAITPHVSLIVVAHNESEAIEAKIENIYALDYPSDRLEVIIGSDGSDDGTNELVSGHAHRGLRLLEFPRSGKIPALNAAVAQATGEILVFSDANSIFAPDALRKLVAPFADRAVGAVGGNQVYVSDPGGHMASTGERAYWRYDRLLKTMQSRAGSMTSATGAIHAIRRELFRPVPLGVSDDFFTSTRAIAHGYRLMFEQDAIAFETVAPSEQAEFDRKLRIIVRGLRSLWAAKDIFNPIRHGFYSLQLFSHKFLRWSIGWLLIVLLGTSLSLYGTNAFYWWFLQAQVVFYTLAACALVLRPTPLAQHRLFKLFGIPFYFCLANAAAVCAWLQVLGGKRVDLWKSKRVAGAHIKYG
jgi:cellulose synthase/poly-beta-1,6-N-acetylglucosamine synthase-like glycosyltransferase